jgi:hypothetical protein
MQVSLLMVRLLFLSQLKGLIQSSKMAIQAIVLQLQLARQLMRKLTLLQALSATK